MIVGRCVVWPGTVNGDGYGRMGRGLAHRMFYERERGPVPEGLELDHLCRNRLCVNPYHLEPVTHHVNVLRAIAATGRTHCRNGHPIDDYHARVQRRPNGSVTLSCRDCQRDSKRRHRARIRERSK